MALNDDKPVNRSSKFKTANWVAGYTIILLCLWSMYVIGAGVWEVESNQRRDIKYAHYQAMSTFQNLRLSYRGAAGRNQLTDGSNKPAFIQQAKQDYGQRVRLVCLHSDAAETKPDAWEARALRSIQHTGSELSSVDMIDGKPYLRLLKACTEDMKLPDGLTSQNPVQQTTGAAVSVTVPLEPLRRITRYEIGDLSMDYTIIWCSGALVILLGHVYLRNRRNKHLRYEDGLAGQIEQAREETIRKSEFLANMSHEFRTPMNAIIGFTELLIEDELTDDQKDYLRTVRNSGKGLLELVNDILDLSKIESGKLKIVKKQCPVQAVIDDVKLLMMTDIESKGLKLDVLKSMGTPETIYTDDLRLKQCLLNLLSNAIKFTDAGSITLHISMYFEKKRQWYRFDVQDTGIGISVDKQKEIFREFVQAEDTTTHTYGGSGLGLCITQQLTELLGGKITLQSQVGEGTMFSIHLPYEEPAVEEQTQPQQAEATLSPERMEIH